MAPVSNACWWRQIASVTRTVPGETESSSAEVQLDNKPFRGSYTIDANEPRASVEK